MPTHPARPTEAAPDGPRQAHVNFVELASINLEVSLPEAVRSGRKQFAGWYAPSLRLPAFNAPPATAVPRCLQLWRRNASQRLCTSVLFPACACSVAVSSGRCPDGTHQEAKVPPWSHTRLAAPELSLYGLEYKMHCQSGSDQRGGEYGGAPLHTVANKRHTQSPALHPETHVTLSICCTARRLMRREGPLAAARRAVPTIGPAEHSSLPSSAPMWS